MTDPDRPSRPAWQRLLTSNWLLSPLLAIALLVATFFGYGYYTRHQTTTYARGGSFAAAPLPGTAPTTSTASPAATQPHASSAAKASTKPSKHHAGATKKKSTATRHKKTSTSSPSTTSSSTPNTSASTTSHSASAAATALAAPKTGVYVLAVSGAEEAKFGPIAACHNKFPSRATLDVHHATGESPTSYDFDLRLYPNNPNKHDERHIYKYSKNSVVLSYEEETVTCSGIKMSSAVDYSPDQIRVEGPLKVGDSWHNHGGGTSRTETGNSNVVAKSTMQVQGKSYTVYEISTKLTLTGSETGYRDQTWWYSPTLGIPLKFGETLHGKRSGANYSEYYSASVISLP